MKSHVWSIALYGAETWALRNVHQVYVGGFEIRSWRRVEKITWTDRVRKGEIVRRVKEERNIQLSITRRKVNWIFHSLRRNCLLKHIIEGKIGGRI